MVLWLPSGTLGRGPHQLLVVAHRVAVAPQMLTMWQWYSRRRGRDLVAEHGAPFLEALVGGEHGRGAFVPRVDESDKEHGSLLGDRQVADLVHHGQCGMGEHEQPPGEVAGGLGGHERVGQPCQGDVVNVAAGFGGDDAGAEPSEEREATI